MRQTLIASEVFDGFDIFLTALCHLSVGFLDTCQLSRFSRESPSCSRNLPVSQLENQISRELPKRVAFF